MVPMNSLSFRSSSNNAGKLSGSPHSMGSSPPRLLFPRCTTSGTAVSVGWTPAGLAVALCTRGSQEFCTWHRGGGGYGGT